MKHEILLAVALLLSASLPAYSEDPRSSVTIMQQAIRSRERLRSGMYSGKGVRIEKLEGKPPRIVDIQHTHLFDFDAGLRRVEFSETPQGETDDKESSSFTGGLLHVTPDYFVSKPASRKNRIHIYRSQARPAIWDPRDIGFLSAFELQRMTPFDETKPVLEEGAASDNASVTFPSPDRRLVEVSFMVDFKIFGYVRKFAFLDLNGHLVPTVREDRQQPYSRDKKPDGDGVVESQVKVSWRLQDGIAVPVTLSMADYTIDEHFRAIEEMSTEMTYGWKMVNGDVDPTEFELEPLLKRLDQPPGSNVIGDLRADPPIYLQYPLKPRGSE